MKNLDGVLEDLQTRVSSRTTSPAPPYQGGVKRKLMADG
jgi:hypothetical protein